MIVLESAYFHPRVGAPDEQAAGTEDRSLDRASSAAATSTPRRPASRARPRCSSRSARDTRAGRANRPLSRARAPPCRCRCAPRASRACSARRFLPSDVARISASRSGSSVRPARRTRAGLDRHRADLSRRRVARSGPHRGGRPALRLRPISRHVPGARGAAAGARTRAIERRPHGSHGADGGGFSESMTFAFIEREAALPVLRSAAQSRRRSPIRCRRSSRCCGRRCCPGCIDSCAHNRRRGRKDVRLFETGSRFTRAPAKAARRRWRGAARRHDAHWSLPRPAGRLLRCEGRRSSCRAPRSECRRRSNSRRSQSSVPGAAAARRTVRPVDGVTVGVLGLLAPAIAEARGFPPAKRSTSPRSTSTRCAVASRRRALPRRVAAAFPVDRARPLDPRRRSLACGRRSWHYPFVGAGDAGFDRRVRSLQGKGVPEGRVSLSLRLTFRSLERTLTDEEVETAMEAIVAALKGSPAPSSAEALFRFP